MKNKTCKTLILTLFIVFGVLVLVLGSYSLVPGQIEPFSETLYIRYVNFDDMSSEPQYDFDETIEVTVEVDTTQVSQNVSLLVALYDPDGNQWDWDDVPDYTTYGSSNDSKTLYLSTYGDLDRWLEYAGGERKWFVKVIVADADTHLLEDTEYKYFWGGPRFIRHFTCKDCSDPDGTRTTTFYDIDEKAYEYAEWDTHGLEITYSINFKWYGPMGLYNVSDPKNLSPGLSFTAVWDSIDIKLNPPGFNPGSWYVEYYFENRYRGRDDFTIEYTGELKYINVPFHFQEEKYYCGPASLEMVFDFYGEDVPQLEIADVARTDPFNGDPAYNGTYHDDMRRAGHFSNLSTSVGNEMPGSITGYSVRKLGYAAFEKEPMTLDDLKNLIDLGYPIIVLTNYSLSSSSGHYRVVIGYDTEEVVLHDPWNKPEWGGTHGGPNITMNYSLFLDLWEYSNCWGLFVSPWETVLTPLTISENRSEISANIKYPCPSPFDTNQYPASSCNATIFLPVGVNLVEGEIAKKTIGGIDAGSSAAVSWTVEVSTSGFYDLSVEVEGRISGSVAAHGSYPGYNYEDRVGEVHQETVHLGAIRVPDEYSTIQEAINAANEGDIILVSTGTYYENVVVNKSVTLIGDSQASIIDGGGIGTVVHVTVGNVNISDFTIRNSNHYGIFVGSADGCIVLRNNVTNNSIGIRIWFSEDCIISENIVTNNREHGISLDNSAGSVLIGNTVSENTGIGIVLSYSNNCTISNNHVGNSNDTGILIDYSRNSTVIENNVTSNKGYGVHLRLSNVSVVSQNNATNNIWNGIELYQSPNSVIDQNNVRNNLAHGILLYHSSNTAVNENIVSDNNATGILLNYSNSCLVSNNNATYNNGNGVHLWESDNCTISGNELNFNVYKGIWLEYSNNCKISNNTVKNNKHVGINFSYSNSSMVSMNVVINNNDRGINLHDSGNYAVISNVVTNNSAGIVLGNSDNCMVSENVVTSNNNTGIILDYSLNSIVIANTVDNNGGFGIASRWSDNSTVIGNNVTNNVLNGIYVEESLHSMVCRNHVHNNSRNGIKLIKSPNCTIYGNNVTRNGKNGINLGESGNSTISKNIVANNMEQGIWIHFSPFCDVSENFVSRNVENGIWLEGSGHCVVSENTVKNNLMRGIWLLRSNNTVILRNLAPNNSKYGIAVGASHGCIVTVNLALNNGQGLRLWRSVDCSISGNEVSNNIDFGIRVYESSNCSISENMVTEEECGIGLKFSNHCFIQSNTIEKSNFGIVLWSSPNNVLRENNMTGNCYNFGVRGDSLQHYIQDIDTSNEVDGKPVYYLVNLNSLVVNSSTHPNMGYLAVVNSTYIIVEDLAPTLKNNVQGVLFAYTTNSAVENTTVVNNQYGIYLWDSSSCLFYCNNITNNDYGIHLFYSSDNKIFHNTFINNTVQAETLDSVSVWDNGYPSSGNFWSDYTGVDIYSGSYQNETGSDGIGDTPYVIDADNQDNYPLMNPWPSGWKLDFIGPSNHPVVDFAIYNGSLYAAANNKLYVYDRSSWNIIDAPTYVLSLEPFEDKLIIGGQSRIYLFNGTDFTLIFSVLTYIKPLGVYNNTLYAGTVLDNPPTLYYCNGSAENPDNWHVDMGFSTILNFSDPFGSIDSFAVYNNRMYITSGGTVYSYNGTNWNITKTYDDVYAYLDMKVYNGKLYLATKDQAWRKPSYQGYSGFSGRVIEFDGNNWTTIFDHDYWIFSLETYDGKLYAGTANTIFAYNGTHWETSFSSEEGVYYAISLITYESKIYAGMGNGYIFADPASEEVNSETIVVPEFPSTILLLLALVFTTFAVIIGKKRHPRKPRG